MRKYYKVLDRDPFEVLPLTFHIKSGTSDPEYKNFLAMHKQYDQQREQAKIEEKELKEKVEILTKEIDEIDQAILKISKNICDVESGKEETKSEEGTN